MQLVTQNSCSGCELASNGELLILSRSLLRRLCSTDYPFSQEWRHKRGFWVFRPKWPPTPGKFSFLHFWPLSALTESTEPRLQEVEPCELFGGQKLRIEHPHPLSPIRGCKVLPLPGQNGCFWPKVAYFVTACHKPDSSEPQNVELPDPRGAPALECRPL